MGIKSDLFRWTITCNDPYRRNCHNEIRSHYGEEFIKQKARKAGWYQSPKETGKWACPGCISFHKQNVDLLKFNAKITMDEANNSADPFTAAFVKTLLESQPKVS